MNLNNLKISTRLTVTFGLLVALLLAMAAAASLQMGRMQSDTQAIAAHWLPGVEVMSRMNTISSDLRNADLQHVLHTDEAAKAELEKNQAVLAAAFEKSRQAYAQVIGGDQERKLHEGLSADWKHYLALHEQILAHSHKNESEQAMQVFNGESQKAFDGIAAAIAKLTELNHDGAIAAIESAAQTQASGRNTMIGTALAALLLASLAAAWLIRSIAGPLARAVAVADRVAEGDLSQPIECNSHDETGQLLHALQRMQQSLVGAVGSVRHNADGVATASSQIAQGNLDLSQRTEQQASSLEETAASMEQLSSTVKQNADNARQANQLALGASTVAIKGGEVVGQVVTTMKGINDSSKKIADIINVIDGIAFQTNILALNAAVEAARAGEQGRGFAVVASEVRNLAGRSADAAKEIKGLITASVERVEQGTALVDQAGTTMQEIVSSIKRVTDIMGEISAASSEQSAGVAQVGEAVTQMDQATQQNAALVEQSAAAAESLKLQAQQLVQAMAVFKLAHGEQHSGGQTAAAKSWQGAERRGPARAKNVSRPAFGAKARPEARDVPTLTETAPAKTGTDNDWASF
jgi:methyl-accepting chemotaxis protein